jgi:hypothetical protein
MGPDQPLTDLELDDEQASELPQREALSLLDGSSLLGGTALPTPAPDAASGSSPPPTTTSAPVDLPGSLGALPDKL